MFCPNCGTENVNGTKFCKNCGSILISNENVDIIQTINSEEIKKKAKPIPGKIIVAIAVALAAIATLLIFLSLPPTIDLNKYIIYEFSGYDGYGNCSVRIDWESIQDDYADRIKWTKEAEEYDTSFYFIDEIDCLSDNIKLHYDIIDGLSNGDEISYTFEYDEDQIKEFIKCNIKSSDGILTVEGLSETKKIDFFAFDLNEYIAYTGPNKSTFALFKSDIDGYQIYKDDNFVVVLSYESGYSISASFIQNNSRVCTAYYYLSDNDYLSNGDIVTVEVDAQNILQYGYAPLNKTTEIVVSDRPGLIDKDMFSYEATWGVAYDLIPSDYWGGGQYSEPELYQVCILEAKETTVTPITSRVLFTCSFDYTDRRGNEGETTYYYVLVDNPYYQERMMYETLNFYQFKPEKFDLDNLISDLEKDYNVYPVYGF